MASALALADKTTKAAGPGHGRWTAYILDWTSHTDGTIDNSITALTGVLAGRIIAFETIPGQNGDLSTDLPTALYDLTVDDSYETDVAAAALANRSGTAGERVNPAVGIPCWAPLTLVGANCGNTKKGRLIIVVEE